MKRVQIKVRDNQHKTERLSGNVTRDEEEGAAWGLALTEKRAIHDLVREMGTLLPWHFIRCHG